MYKQEEMVKLSTEERDYAYDLKNKIGIMFHLEKEIKELREKLPVPNSCGIPTQAKLPREDRPQRTIYGIPATPEDIVTMINNRIRKYNQLYKDIFIIDNTEPSDTEDNRVPLFEGDELNDQFN